jgi:hypothetical protein
MSTKPTMICEVSWQIWGPTDHDWIGRKTIRGVRPTDRRPPPLIHRQTFGARSLAEAFIAKLRREHGDDVATHLDNLPRPRRSRPQQQLLPGDWPLQRREMTEGEWPTPKTAMLPEKKS